MELNWPHEPRAKRLLLLGAHKEDHEELSITCSPLHTINVLSLRFSRLGFGFWLLVAGCRGGSHLVIILLIRFGL